MYEVHFIAGNAGGLHTVWADDPADAAVKTLAYLGGEFPWVPDWAIVAVLLVASYT